MLRRWTTPPLPPPPDALRPWYYQRLFLIPVFIFSWPIHPTLFILWPAWAILIIRSPWHNTTLLGALAWANLFSGGYIAVMDLFKPDLVGLETLAYIVPGLVLTLVTQLHWFKQRQRIAAWRRERQAPPPSEAAPAEVATPRLRRRSRRPHRHGGPR